MPISSSSFDILEMGCFVCNIVKLIGQIKIYGTELVSFSNEQVIRNQKLIQSYKLYATSYYQDLSKKNTYAVFGMEKMKREKEKKR